MCLGPTPHERSLPPAQSSPTRNGPEFPRGQAGRTFAITTAFKTEPWSKVSGFDPYQHHQIIQPVFSPAAQPTHPPIVKPRAHRHRSAKAKVLRFNLHVVVLPCSAGVVRVQWKT